MRGNFKHQLSKWYQDYVAIAELRTAYRLLMPYVFRRWGAYAVLFAIFWVDIILTLVFAWYFGKLTNTAIEADLAGLKSLAFLGIGLIVVSIGISFLNTYTETLATNGVKRDLENDLYTKVLQSPFSVMNKQHSGDLLSTFHNDIHSLDGVIGSSLIDLIKMPVIYIAVFLYLFQLNAVIALISLCAAPVALAAGAIFGLLLRGNGRRTQALLSEKSSLLHETFQNHAVIRAFPIVSLLFGKFKDHNNRLFTLDLQNAKLQGWFDAGSYAVSSIIYLISLSLGAFYISNNQMSVGELLTFLNLVNHLVYPLTGAAGQWAGFQRSIASVERISRLFDRSVHDRPVTTMPRADCRPGPIRFDGVTFHYEDQQKLFEGLHLTIPAGSVTAIVGRSGAGKTTLFHLLQGFYHPSEGHIYIGEQDIAQLHPSELRNWFSYVSQEPQLFDISIRENLSYARPGLTDEAIREAAARVQMDDYIMSLPDGYDTQMGERGVRLSGGQKQRLTIARALLKDAPILLLDEVTSALDTQTERQVRQAIEQLMQGRTTLMITHRMAAARDADQIVVLDQGQIVQAGTHMELMQSDSYYRRLQQGSIRLWEGESIS